MMAAELYQKTLAGYKASLAKGESVTLSRYCKIHHVNSRGMRYWMKKHSIVFPGNKSRKVSTQAGINHISNPVTSSGHMIPLLIQSPGLEKSEKSIRRLNGINTFEYFTDILNRLAYISPIAADEVFQELLPNHWTKK